ncbi:hypothetical protein CANCADRAFT_146037 [Tortispora caseinolytica NRRL Y-17796]|uniref:Uncharacterized protein n=1 Tax=Tortispora caseinolytica NRRL Y-17796 TaxID=767744 RepID=A0A1E4T9H1_9ASCO|nr:hypothetical protein CANCADRAFT_146037 [Tortispora caseinolytica NRRL Y-17796]
MGSDWIAIQEKAFVRWVNSKLEPRYEPIDDLTKGLRDGVKLIQLLESIDEVSLGKYATKPKFRVQMIENVNIALKYIRRRGVHLANIGAEDVVDGNKKLILGMIWTLVLNFSIAEISEEGVSAKDGLLLWCQRVTAEYDGVDVHDFATSFADGLAFCALIDAYRPDLLDYSTIDRNDHRGNIARAYKVMQESMGVAPLLDVGDVCDTSADERSMIAYLASWFHVFSWTEKLDKTADLIEKFVSRMARVRRHMDSYKVRAQRLHDLVKAQQKALAAPSRLPDEYGQIRALLNELDTFKRGDKTTWMLEKFELLNIYMKMENEYGTYHLKRLKCPEHLRSDALERQWARLESEEGAYGRMLMGKLAAAKSEIAAKYVALSNEVQHLYTTITAEICSLEDDADHQLEVISQASDKLRVAPKKIEEIKELETLIKSAHVDVYSSKTSTDLEAEYALVRQNVSQKLSILGAQLEDRHMHATAEQVEQYESAFVYFDHDQKNYLTATEFQAAVSSLGVGVFDNLDYVVNTVSDNTGKVTKSEFVEFMALAADEEDPIAQVLAAFTAVSLGKDVITDEDLNRANIDEKCIHDIRTLMPHRAGGYDYSAYLTNQ